MTIAESQALPGADAACRQCNSINYAMERDPAGIILTCRTCGTCTYLDQNGQPTRPELKPEKPQTAPADAVPTRCGPHRCQQLDKNPREALRAP